jgi:hypothetical protein
MAAVATIIVHDGPTTAEFIVSLLVAGGLAPLLAALQSRWSDRRRFRFERGQNASGDLIRCAEDVLDRLDELGDRCAAIRQIYFGPMMKAVDEVWQRVLAAEDAYQRTRLAIARLEMRPHADPALIEKGKEASKELFKAIHAVRGHVIRHRASLAATGVEPAGIEPVDLVEESIENGYALTREYVALAQAVIAKLQRPPEQPGRFSRRREQSAD